MNANSDIPKSIYLIDASIYIFQAHFSPYVECKNRRGEELSALFGFTQFLLQFLAREKPSHLAVAQDQSLFCGFRHALCSNYKSNRELPDENLEMQLQACHEICELLAVPSFGSRVYEADDIIGTLAARLRLETGDCCAMHIVSKDKDLAQLLVNEADILWDYSGNRKRNRQHITDEFGVLPDCFPDYLGLTGDSVDCISGVPGIGPVKARALLQEFGSLEGIYRNLDNLADLPVRGAKKLADTLRENRELALLSKKLATIVCDVDVPTELFSQASLQTVGRGGVDQAALVEFLERYQFQAAERERISRLAERI